jgi:hypothetical protein
VTQPLFDSWLMTLWSIFFVSLPILLYGIFEKVSVLENLMSKQAMLCEKDHSITALKID